MKGYVFGNALISAREEYIARVLRERNLCRVNRESKPVIPRDGIYVRYIKRVLDICVAFIAFILVSPINAALAICTLIDVGHPIIFRQTRSGKNGEPFEIIKFRNMTNDCDEHGDLLPASQRVTKFGKFVRRLSLDELMNFWSVLKGDMSIIGPRPLPVFFEERYSDRHKMRNVVRPGLECPRLISDDSVPRYHEQFENDVWYVENVSFLTDLRMVFELFRMTFNLSYRKKGSDVSSYFVGYDQENHAISEKKALEEYPEFNAPSFRRG